MLARAIDADEPPLLARQPLDGRSFEAVAANVRFGEFGNAREHSVADADIGFDVDLWPARCANRQQHGRAFTLVLPHRGLGDEVAVIVASRHLQHGDGGQAPLATQALAVARQRAVLGHAGEQPVELDPFPALDAEGARDLAFADLAGRRTDEVEDFLPAGETAARRGAASVALRFARHGQFARRGIIGGSGVRVGCCSFRFGRASLRGFGRHRSSSLRSFSFR